MFFKHAFKHGFFASQLTHQTRGFAYLIQPQSLHHQMPIQHGNIKGNLHAPECRFKIHIIPEHLGNHQAMTDHFRNNRDKARLHGVTSSSVFSYNEQSSESFKGKNFSTQTNILCQNVLTLTKGIRGSEIPTVSQTESLKDKYKGYCEHCHTEKVTPKTMKEFMAEVYKLAQEQGLTSNFVDISEEDIVLLKNSIYIDNYKFEAATYIYNEIQFRDPTGASFEVELAEDNVFCRVEGVKGFEFYKENKSGIFYTPGLQVQSSEPLEDGTLIHPITLHMLMAVGVGARQPLTEKRLVINAHNCLLKMEKGEKPTDKEKTAYDEWMKLWNSDKKEDKTYLITYQATKGERILHNNAQSPKGNLTTEVYMSSFDATKMSCEMVQEGTKLRVFNNGRALNLEISESAKIHDLLIEVPAPNPTMAHQISNTKLVVTEDEAKKHRDGYDKGMKDLLEKFEARSGLNI